MIVDPPSTTMDPRMYMQLPYSPLPPRTQALSSKTFNIPPLDGSLTVAQMLDWQAEHSPNHAMYEYVEDDGTVSKLKFPEVQRAVHRGAKLVKEVLSMENVMQGKKRALVAIVANADTVTYSTMHIATMRAGLPVFPISPRNSAIAVAQLLKNADVGHVLVGDEPAMQELVASAFQFLKESDVPLPTTSRMPIFEDLYLRGTTDTLELLPPLEKQEITDAATVIHSSGSTAFPKPVTWTNYVHIMQARWPHYHERDMTGMRVSCHAIPMFHGMGVVFVCFAVAVGTTLTTFKPQFPPQQPDPESVLKAAMATSSDLLFCVPSMLETWCKLPEQVEWIQRTQGVLYGGAPLAQEVGDLLASKGVNIFTLYGCTEYGISNYILPETGLGIDWVYFEFSPVCATHFVPLEDGNFRLVLVANERQTPSVLNTAVNGIGAYDTNDIFSPHPTKEGLWKIEGRADEQIMHSTGEKTNPAPLEPLLNQDPHIAAAVMFGRGKFQPGVLIDPKPEYKFDPNNIAKLEAFRNAVWPTVEKVNDFAPQHSRIFKEMIIVSTPSKPFTYTGKGTARRPAVIEQYHPEIEALYSAVEETTQAHLPAPSSWTVINTIKFIRAVVHHVMTHSVSDSDDLFQNGCDSLQATWIRNSILHAVRQTTQANIRSLPGNFVYQHPSINVLSTFISDHAGSSVQQSGESNNEERLAAMYSILDKYSMDFQKHVPTVHRPSEDVVLVTGTTGGLGTALLAALVEDPKVQRVYAVNRHGGAPLAERQRQVLIQRGYDADRVMSSDKVILVETDMDGDNFGFSPDLYDEIRNSITHIIHNAWPVNFNVSLSFFERSIRGLRTLVDLALSSPQSCPPTLLFISSIGVLRNVRRTIHITETPIEASVAVGMGYGESKWVCEQLLSRASGVASESGTTIRAIAVRLGQITGTSNNGAWNTTEYLPSMLKSSQYLGCVPELDAEVSWIPVDVAAHAILEMSRSPGPFSTYHLIHPRPVHWRTLFRPVATAFDVNPVAYHTWLRRLKKSNEWFSAASPDQEVEQMKINPALKIIDFFESAVPVKGASTNEDPVRGNAKSLAEGANTTKSFEGTYEALGLPRLSVSEAMRVAPSLQPENLPQLTANDALRWVQYWRSIGYLR